MVCESLCLILAQAAFSPNYYSVPFKIKLAQNKVILPSKVTAYSAQVVGVHEA